MVEIAEDFSNPLYFLCLVGKHQITGYGFIAEQCFSINAVLFRVESPLAEVSLAIKPTFLFFKVTVVLEELTAENVSS